MTGSMPGWGSRSITLSAKVITIRACNPWWRTCGGAGWPARAKGRYAVFFDDLPELKGHPALVQKSDGGFNYTTTDLATLQFRLEGGCGSGPPDEIIYVTDGRQQLHFQQLFAVFRRWHPEARVQLAHVWFGSILGEDGKPFKTRSGETVRLEDLLDEAEERAFQVVSAKNPEWAEEARRQIARLVGLGAIKYADLSQNRQSDYVFSWDKMLSLQGQHGSLSAIRLHPHAQHFPQRRRGRGGRGRFRFRPGAGGAGRNCFGAAAAGFWPGFGSGGRRSTVRISSAPTSTSWRGILPASTRTAPCSKPKADSRASRLALCDLTARVLQQGLGALGIATTEQM